MLSINASKLALVQVASGIALSIALIIAGYYIPEFSSEFIAWYIPFQIAAGIYALFVARDSSKKPLGRAEYTAFIGYTAIYLVLVSPVSLLLLLGGIAIANLDLEWAMRCRSEEFRNDSSCLGVDVDALARLPLNILTVIPAFIVISLVGAASTTTFLLKFLLNRRITFQTNATF